MNGADKRVVNKVRADLELYVISKTNRDMFLKINFSE